MKKLLLGLLLIIGLGSCKKDKDENPQPRKGHNVEFKATGYISAVSYCNFKQIDINGKYIFYTGDVVMLNLNGDYNSMDGIIYIDGIKTNIMVDGLINSIGSMDGYKKYRITLD